MHLILFDCDGTLVDSQHLIVAAMDRAFTSLDLAAPTRAETLRVVGLSLPEAFAVLAPKASLVAQAALADAYRESFPVALAEAQHRDKLFDGIGPLIMDLARRDDVVLGVATGKSRRGVVRLFDQEDWHAHFTTIQTADDNPSKPHPGMILRAMSETGIAPHSTIMIGDTTYDMEMARCADVTAVGVAWGYHPVTELSAAGAQVICHDHGALRRALWQRLDHGAP